MRWMPKLTSYLALPEKNRRRWPGLEGRGMEPGGIDWLSQCAVREVPVVNWGWVLITSEARDAAIPGVLRRSATKLVVKKRPKWRRELPGRYTTSWVRLKHLMLGVIVLGGLVWAGYAQYQDPRVQELFGAKRQPRVQPSPRPVRISQPAPTPTAKPEAVRAEKPDPQSAAANRQLASTILGILAARQLAAGISLTVTDDILAVIGQVVDEEKKRGILNVLENARGHRRLDATLLTVSMDAGKGPSSR